MVENFDDNKLASEQSFSQMARNYALKSLNGKVVSTLNNDDVVEDEIDVMRLALNMEDVGELLKRITNLSVDTNLKQFYQRFLDINQIELDDLISKFNLKSFKTHNPKNKFINSNNLLKLKMQTIYNEIKNIEFMFNALKSRLGQDKQVFFSDAILRRLNMVELILE